MTGRRFVAWLCLASTVGAGCGGGSTGGAGDVGEPSPVALPPSQSSQPTHGHFLGEADAEGDVYFVEALVTVDGAVRMHVSSFLWDRAFLQAGGGPSEDLADPEHSTQFVGDVEFDGSRASGTGVVLGQNCHTVPPGRFCDEPADAQITFTVSADGDLEGALRVSTPAGLEVWALNLSAWSIWYDANASTATATYRERLAAFARADDVRVNFGIRRMSFRSAATGCAGDGSVTPHLDGRFGVYDVVLIMEDCRTPYAHLNGELQGLATHTQSGYWDYDSWLVVFLAAPDGAPPRAAVTMRAYSVYPD